MRPLSSSSVPSDAAANPFPRELTTPPVTKIYFMGGKLIRSEWKIQPPDWWALFGFDFEKPRALAACQIYCNLGVKSHYESETHPRTAKRR